MQLQPLGDTLRKTTGRGKIGQRIGYSMLKVILFVDALINLVLGLLLLVFSPGMIHWLGVPSSSTRFYPNILGAIFIGITVALVIGASAAGSHRNSGLGLLGAISINLCGGTALALWLIFGRLQIPAKGFVFLWVLVVVLIAVSVAELFRFGGSEKT